MYLFCTERLRKIFVGQRIVHSGRGLKKCGYESPCVVQSGEQYEVMTNEVRHGSLAARTWGQDNDCLYLPQYFNKQNYIEATLSGAETFKITVSLYDILSVEAA